MNNIADAFSQGAAFIAYLTAGDGGLEYSERAFIALIKGGVNLLEIGVPFSDPVADGPVIQQAMMRALAQKITMQDILALVKRIRVQSKVPIVLFSYYNPILNAGVANFYQLAKASGVDGLLIVDLPPEEAADHERECLANKIAPIYLISPVTPVDRIKLINRHGRGFLYYVAHKGTTGMRSRLPQGIADNLTQIKQHTDLPVAVGFGIADKQSAKTVLNHADGFVVGSYFVNAVADKVQPIKLTNLARGLDPRV